MGSPGGSDSKESGCSAGDPGLIPGSGRFPWRRDRLSTPVFLGFPAGSDGKESAYKYKRPGFNPWVGKIPWRREWPPPPVFLPGEFHGQRILAGCSPWVCKESDMTEQLTLSLFSNDLLLIW